MAIGASTPRAARLSSLHTSGLAVTARNSNNWGLSLSLDGQRAHRRFASSRGTCEPIGFVV